MKINIYKIISTSFGICSLLFLLKWIISNHQYELYGLQGIWISFIFLFLMNFTDISEKIDKIKKKLGGGK